MKLPKAKKGKGVISKGLYKFLKAIPKEAVAPECKHEWEPYRWVEVYRTDLKAEGKRVARVYCKFCLQVRDMP
ncbi:MAG: hypothetical protein AAB922_01650 [Patescibacteria group bacterium]